MMETPKVSLIIPIYRNPEWVKIALDSALGQTYSNMEFLLVDDGSPDGCDLLCDEYAKVDERVRVFHCKNRGVSAARNVGLDNAVGDFISFLDSDDKLEPDHIKNLVFAMESEKADLVSDEMCFYEGKFKTDVICRDPKKMFFTPETAVVSMHREHVFKGYVLNKLFRRDVICQIRFAEDVFIHEDMLFLWNVLLQCKTIVHIPVIGYHYLYHGNSAMNGSFSEKYESSVAAAKKMFDLMMNHFPHHEALARKTLLFSLLSVANKRALCGDLDRKHYRRIFLEMKKYHSAEAFRLIEGADNRISYRLIFLGKGVFLAWKKLVKGLKEFKKMVVSS